MESFTIRDIVKQIEGCCFECEAGPITQNVAFIKLKEMAGRNYQTERYIGETLYTENGIKVQVISLNGKYQSRKGGYIVPVVCRDIYQKSKTIEFKTLLTLKEQKEKEIKAALDILKKHNYVER